MFGTSYSGFNSLQIACERPPALKAVCAIYSSDDRWTDDVHWRGGALQAGRPGRLLPLHDADVRAAARAGGVAGDGVARGVAAAAGDQRAVGADLAAGEPRRAVLAARARSRADRRYDRIEAATMMVAGWADGYRNNSFRTVEALRRGRRAAPAAGRSVGARRPGQRDARARGSTWTSRWSAWFDRWLRGRPDDGERRRTGPTCSSRVVDRARARPRPARGLLGGGAVAAARTPRRACDARRAALAATSSRTSGSAPGSTARVTCPGACPATSATTTPAR